MKPPYPELVLLFAQSCVFNPIVFAFYLLTYRRMLRSQLEWATEEQLPSLSQGNKSVLKFFIFILQFLAVASVTIFFGALSLMYTDDVFINYFFEIMYCVRHVSSIMLAYGVSNSIKKELEMIANARES